MKISLEESWQRELVPEQQKPYFKRLVEFVEQAYAKRAVYPKPKDVFRALELCPFEKVAVVILGQDPYHGAGQANGLCFAVSDGMALPPSLWNIYKEIAAEYDVPLESLSKQGGDLSRWANQGVLLLNATLTVEAHSAGSHQGKGWEAFTDAVIKVLSDKREHLVFMLWGNYAKKKGVHIDRGRHLVLESPHPSPLSAWTGFFGNGHFKQANAYLEQHGKTPVNWL